LIVTGITIKNCFSLKDVTLKPDSKLNVFIGKNAAGKSSIIKAIEIALRGTNDKTVIRNGSDNGEVMLDLTDKVVVDRILKQKGANKLTVKAPMSFPGGETKVVPLPSPQDFLDGVISDFSFDPIQFVLMDGKERAKYLREIFKVKANPELLAGIISEEVLKRLDFTKDGLEVLKDAENIVYPQRTEINKIVSQKKALYDASIAKLNGFNPETFVDRTGEIEKQIDDCNTRLTEARTLEKTQKSQKERIEKLEVKKKDAQGKLDTLDVAAIAAIPTLEEEIKAINEQINALLQLKATKDSALEQAQNIRTTRDDLTEEIARHQETIDSYDVKDVPDVEGIEKELALILEEGQKAAEERDRNEQYVKAQEVLAEHNENKKKSEAMTETIDALRKTLPEKLLAEAQIPIKDIRVDGEKVFIGDISIDNCSTKEQVGISLDIVRKLNEDKPLKVICLDRAESLDPEALAEFDRQIQPDEFQYWITLVSGRSAEGLSGNIYHVQAGEVTEVGAEEKEGQSIA